MIILKLFSKAEVGGLEKYSTVVSNIYTPNRSGSGSSDTRTIVHNLNSTNVNVRVRQSGDLETSSYGIQFDFVEMWNWALVGYNVSIIDKNTISVTFFHSWTTGYYNRVVDVYKVA